jgi:hypothetical protein
LELDGGIHGKLSGTKKIDAGGADIPSDQGDRKVFDDLVDAVKL